MNFWLGQGNNLILQIGNGAAHVAFKYQVLDGFVD